MTDSAPSKRPLRLSEVVEKGVEGVFEFLVRYFRTVVLVLHIKRDVILDLLGDRRRPKARYVMPLTYAAVGMFLLSVVTQAAGTNPLNWIWFYDEISKNVFENLTKEVSLTAIAIGAIPALAGLLVIAAVHAVAAGPDRIRARLSLIATCYAVGTQAFLLFLAAAFLALGQFPSSKSSGDQMPAVAAQIDAAQIGAAFAVLVLLCILVASITVVPWFLFRSFGIRRLWRQSRARSIVLSIVVLVSTLSGLWVYPVLANLPTYLAGLAKPSTAPVVSLVSDVGSDWRDGWLFIRADIQIENPSAKSLAFRNKDISGLVNPVLPPDQKGAKRPGLGLEMIRAVDLYGRATEFSWVRPRDIEWRRLTFKTRMPRAEYQQYVATPDKNCLEFSIRIENASVSTPCVHARLVNIPNLGS